MARFAVIFLLVSMLVGCNTTRVINDWHENTYQGPPLRGFLIIGLDANENRRRFFETEFSREFQTRGLSAIPSFRLIEGRLPEAPEVVLELAREQTGADTILVTRLVDIKREESYVPPTYSFFPRPFYDHYSPAHYMFYDYYGPAHHMMYHPGYTVINTTVILESSIYSSATGQLLWTATTSSFNPSDGLDVVKGLAALTVKRLSALGFLAGG